MIRCSHALIGTCFHCLFPMEEDVIVEEQTIQVPLSCVGLMTSWLLLIVLCENILQIPLPPLLAHFQQAD